MQEESKLDGPANTMRQINQAWLNGRIEDLVPMVHPEMVMVIPGFAGTVEGREDFLAGFRDFCENARVHEFREHDHQVNVAGDVGWRPFDTTWSMSVPANEAVRPVGICGCSRSITGIGLPSGERCWRSTNRPPDSGVEPNSGE